MAGSYIVNVPKLKGGENYDEWDFAAENFLILDGIDVQSKKDAEDTTEDRKAKAKLIMTIDSSLYVHINYSLGRMEASEDTLTILVSREELFRVEEALREAWCEAEDFDESAFQEDQDTAATYKNRWSQLRTRYDIHKDTRNNDGDNKSGSAHTSHTRQPQTPLQDARKGHKSS